MKYLSRERRLLKAQQQWDNLKESEKQGTKRPGSFNKCVSVRHRQRKGR